MAPYSSALASVSRDLIFSTRAGSSASCKEFVLFERLCCFLVLCCPEILPCESFFWNRGGVTTIVIVKVKIWLLSPPNLIFGDILRSLAFSEKFFDKKKPLPGQYHILDLLFLIFIKMLQKKLKL